MTTETNDLDAFTPEERAYIDANGEPVELQDAEGEEAGLEEDADASEEQSEDGDKASADDGAKKKSDTVPHAAFHAKNEELKKTRDELRQLQTQMAIANDRFERFERLQVENSRPKPVEEKIPDKNEDPIGYIDHMDRQMKELTETFQRQEQERGVQQEIQQFREAIRYEEQQYMAENPDYVNAANFVSGVMQRNLQAAGVPPQQMRQIHENELMRMALQAKQSGRSVPEAVYQIAQNYGYRPAQEETTDQTASHQDTLEKVAAGQKANKGVGGAGGSSGGKMTLEKFASMSEAESMAWLEKNPNGYQKLMVS